MRIYKLLLLGVVLVLAAVPCLATPITFAGYTESAPTDITVTYSTPGGFPTNTITGAGAITFFFENLGSVPAGLQGNLAATLNFTASSTDPVLSGAQFRDQEQYSGSFTITLNSAYGAYAPGTFVLLAATLGQPIRILPAPSAVCRSPIPDRQTVKCCSLRMRTSCPSPRMVRRRSG